MANDNCRKFKQNQKMICIPVSYTHLPFFESDRKFKIHFNCTTTVYNLPVTAMLAQVPQQDEKMWCVENVVRYSITNDKL